MELPRNRQTTASAVIGEDADEQVIYNSTLGELAHHYGFLPKACRPYRPETKGKVERSFRYIREDFFLGGISAIWRTSICNPKAG